MRNMTQAIWAIAAMVTLALGQAAYAQDAPDPVGEWSGTMQGPEGDITLVIYVTRDEDGALEGQVENAFQAPGRLVPMSEIAVEDGTLTWRVARIGASYEGNWNAAEQQWQGTFDQGLAAELAFTRGQPDPGPVVEGLDGTWRGTLAMNQATLRLVLNVATGERGTVMTLDSPDQGANGLPITNLVRDGQQVSFEFAPGRQRFEGTLSADGTELEGLWHTPLSDPMPITLARTSGTIERAVRNRPQLPEPPFPYTVEEVAFDNPDFEDVHLAGSLTLPEGDGPFPAAVLITGSGAQDRDETLLGHKPFAVIADHLTRNGIAVLRYDDRGVGGSTGDYSAATSADLATDANAAARYLATRAEIRPDAIGLIGHSEGGIVAPIAMAGNDDIAFLVMLAGPGTALDQLLLSQRRLAGVQMGMSEEILDSGEPVVAAVFAAIVEAETYEAGVEAARALLTPDAMEAIGAPRELPPEVILGQFGTEWFRYFLRYDPAPNLARIEVPILALNGSLDVQVPAADNLAAIAAATAGNPDVTTMELPGLNHLFQTAGTGAIGEYADIEETFAPSALAIVSDWIRARFVTE